MTYSAPLKATLRLIVSRRPATAEASPEHHREGSLPRRAALLTELGTFVINGAERVIVSAAAPLAGRRLRGVDAPQRAAALSSRIIPFRGSWVEFTVDIHDVIYVHIDKKKKFPATALLRAFGYGENRTSPAVLRRARPRPHHEARGTRRTA
jgi:DNA-directed RNA polymerase subunit beta